MAITINGSGTVTGITAGGLPDAIITQPDLAANVAGNGPAFSARSSATTAISAATWTKIAFTSEDFDTNSNYNNTGSTVGSTPAYAFLPTVAGYYQFSAGVILNNTTSTGTASFYKNGSSFSATPSNTGGIGILGGLGGTALIYLNGSTDYVEFYVVLGVGASLAGQSPATFFQAFLARAA